MDAELQMSSAFNIRVGNEGSRCSRLSLSHTNSLKCQYNLESSVGYWTCVNEDRNIQ